MTINKNTSTQWQVEFTKKVLKQTNKLPANIRDALYILKGEIEFEGPLQPEWFHFGKIRGTKQDTYHCHLNKGTPRFVAVWSVTEGYVNFVEIRYAGTHENVDYGKF